MHALRKSVHSYRSKNAERLSKVYEPENMPMELRYLVVGAILFYLIDRFVRDGRLGNLLKILVVLICAATGAAITRFA